MTGRMGHKASLEGTFSARLDTEGPVITGRTVSQLVLCWTLEISYNKELKLELRRRKTAFQLYHLLFHLLPLL